MVTRCTIDTFILYPEVPPIIRLILPRISLSKARRVGVVEPGPTRGGQKRMGEVKYKTHAMD